MIKAKDDGCDTLLSSTEYIDAEKKCIARAAASKMLVKNLLNDIDFGAHFKIFQTDTAAVVEESKALDMARASSDTTVLQVCIKVFIDGEKVKNNGVPKNLQYLEETYKRLSVVDWSMAFNSIVSPTVLNN